MVQYAIIGYMLFYGIYLIYAVDSPFWNSSLFIAIDSLILVLLIDKLKLINKHVIIGGMVFIVEHLAFNLSIINKDKITYYDLCTSFNVCILFIASLIITSTVILICQYKKWIR